jgi:hypothetical protein
LDEEETARLARREHLMPANAGALKVTDEGSFRAIWEIA